MAGDHITKAPASITYASAIYRETVIAALNNVEVKSADISNAYAQAPVMEKMWTILHFEFGSNARKIAVIVEAWYGSKSAGVAFKSCLASFMESMGYLPWVDQIYG